MKNLLIELAAKAKRWWALVPKGWPLALAGMLVALVAGASYLILRDDMTLKTVAAGPAAAKAYNGGHFFQSSVAAIYKERDGRLAKAAHEVAEALKDVKTDVQAVKIDLERVKSAVGLGAAGGGTREDKGTITAPAGQSVSGGPAPAKAEARLGEPGAAASTRLATPPPPLDPRGRLSDPPASGGEQKAQGSPGTPGYAAPYGRSPAGARPLSLLSLPRRGPATISFPVRTEESEREAVTLPAGAFVKARMLTGVAAPEGKPYPVLIALDFAHVLPNRHRLDLSGCFMILKAQGDLSTERLQMQATRLSCVARSGRMFEREVTGFVADDKDNNFAVSGEVQSKQGRVAVMAFLASVVEGVGKAIQAAQTSEQQTALGGHETVVSGSQQKYALAGGASDAASQVAGWYLKEAEHLLPTINVNSGREIWVVMQESVSLPSTYFQRGSPEGETRDSYSYVTRLLE